MKTIVGKHAPQSQKVTRAAMAMLEQARKVLAGLKADDKKGGHTGTRTKTDHLKFETLIFSLLPEQAKDEELLSTIGELLDVDWRALQRAWLRKDTVAKANEKGAISAALDTCYNCK